VANNAVVAESVVAIVTRHNNPKNIRGWDDLTRSAFVYLKRPYFDTVTDDPSRPAPSYHDCWRLAFYGAKDKL